MDVRSQYSSRYKKDLSIDNLRAKVARRKSITQKENRHKEFRKSRGLSIADANVSLVKELTVVEEMNESAHDNKPANQARTKEEIVKEERRAMLQRFKEDKQLRKLKDQREKASKGIFKCGIYKPETSFIPVLTTQTSARVKPKPPAPSVTRVTRSTAKTELPASKMRTAAILVNVLSNKAPVDRVIPKGRGQTSVVKKNESKVSAIPSLRTTRSAAHAKLPTDKIPQKNTAATKSQKKSTKEISPEVVIAKTESPVTDQSNDKVQEPEPNLKDTSVENETLSDVHKRKPSFAPQNFVFQPLDGLSTLKFQPMTPTRANAFLTPTFTWSPVDGKRKYVVSREHNADDHKIDLVSPTKSSLTTTEVKPKLDFNVSPLDKVLECASDGNSAPQSSPVVTSPPCEPSAEVNKTTEEQSLHDVPYFRDNLKSEIQKLTMLCSDWDTRIDMDIPEDAKDLIRTTVGQTRLLMTERFKQFEGLVNNCEFKQGEKETTCTDLDGFWDMIYFQIEDVGKKFVNLGKLEKNSWQQNTVQAKKVVRKKTASVATVKPSQGDDGRAAARSRLAAIKAAMRNKVKVEESAEVEAPIIPMHVDPVVFDAGFFRIESPAKLPGSLRINRSSSEKTNTPKSTKKIVQNSATPITNIGEGSKPEKSLSPVKSLVRKSLFGIPEESLQNQEASPIMPYPPHTEAHSVPAVVDLTKYLVQSRPMGLAAEESPGLLKCLGLAASETTQDGCDTEADIETSGTDDVFMCSPGPIVLPTAASSLPSELGTDEDVETTSNPLDFLGSCTPIMIKHSPMRVEPGVSPTDLIMFSPMDE